MEKLLHQSSKRSATSPSSAVGGDTPTPIAEGLAELLEIERAQKETTASRGERKAAERREVAAIVAEEPLDDADTVLGSDQAAELATLTGQPRDDDIFVYAMLVCAPWTALSAFKYKVKIVPGAAAGKKSKVANDALQYFIHQSAGTREVDLVKGLAVEEASQLLPQASRLVLPGVVRKVGAGTNKKKGGKRRGANKRAARRAVK